MSSAAKVPVTVLCGQLGSGKSVLLQRILTGQRRHKVAVVMNEFAQTVDIEGHAVRLSVQRAGVEVPEWVELENGCLCCSAQDQGVRALESLMRRQRTFDYIIIETTGVADPSQVAALFWLDSGLESALYLDGIVTVVDCVNFERQLQEEATQASGTVTKYVPHPRRAQDLFWGIQNSSSRQVAVADSLYLSKLDLVNSQVHGQALHLIRELNGAVQINGSNLPLEQILGQILHLDAFSAYQRIPKELDHVAVDQPKEHLLNARLEPKVGQLTNPNFKSTHSGITSIVVPLPALDLVNSSNSRFDKVFRALVWEGRLGDQEEPGTLTILRAKGILKDQLGHWYILQAVRDLYEIQQIPQSRTDILEGIQAPKLVLIGKNLGEGLGQRFLNCMQESFVVTT